MRIAYRTATLDRTSVPVGMVRLSSPVRSSSGSAILVQSGLPLALLDRDVGRHRVVRPLGGPASRPGSSSHSVHLTVGRLLLSQLNCQTRQRSEEHTSELQSLMRISYAVFCLKKKKITHIITT